MITERDTQVLLCLARYYILNLRGQATGLSSFQYPFRLWGFKQHQHPRRRVAIALGLVIALTKLLGFLIRQQYKFINFAWTSKNCRPRFWPRKRKIGRKHGRR